MVVDNVQQLEVLKEKAIFLYPILKDDRLHRHHNSIIAFVFVDIDEKTWQIDLNLVEDWLFENTYLKENNRVLSSYKKDGNQRIAAIMPVHVLGGLTDIEKLKSISEKYHIPIIEDSTEALGSYYNNQHAGTFGNIGVISFNGNKIISTGGGGMLITNNDNFAEKSN